VAVGQTGDPSFLHEEDGIKSTTKVIIQVNPETMATSKEGVFAGGDAAFGSRSVIEAIADGRKAAASIDLFLGGDGIIDEVIVLPEIPDGCLGKREDFLTTPRHGMLLRPWQQVVGCHPGAAMNEEILVAKFGEVEQGLDEMMALSQADRCLQCDLRTYLSKVTLPPESWLEFNSETIATVPAAEGVYQFFNEEKVITAIVGTSNLRQSLEEKLIDGNSAVYFTFEENLIYTQRESQLIQQFIQQHGHFPEGGNDLDDLL
jgi:formate dehydrogenase (NADP+) beta subunit